MSWVVCHKTCRHIACPIHITAAAHPLPLLEASKSKPCKNNYIYWAKTSNLLSTSINRGSLGACAGKFALCKMCLRSSASECDRIFVCGCACWFARERSPLAAFVGAYLHSRAQSRLRRHFILADNANRHENDEILLFLVDGFLCRALASFMSSNKVSIFLTLE